MTISLTDREVETILEACGQYIEILGEAEDTSEYTEYVIDTGLGSALKKISKGRMLYRVYSSFKTVRKYPSFEEWKKTKAEMENEE